jgi:beta-N-acetylhexosaminidase
MRTWARRILNLVVVATLLLGLGWAAPAHAQEDPEKLIPKIIAQMTPEAKVGQLFVVAFPGTDTAIGSDIADLILNYHVGGVVLSTASGNIVNLTGAPTQTASLIASLQNLVRTAANTPGAAGRVTPFIPLFVALEQSGDGLPHTQLVSGMSPLPSPMAVGATWNPDDAVNVGKLVGTELAAVGVNLLLGPSLDVLDTPRQGDAGMNVFGGDPYWVGVMGQHYVRGLRAGSEGHVAAVLGNFPGQGGMTEAGDEVDRSLEQLKEVELMPFLSMLQTIAGEPRPLADAMMTSHMRYRGFTGNIRQRTAPLSLDAQAMQALLALPDVKSWRTDAGGVLVSGSLGSPLIRRYYDPLLLTFPAQRAALDALQAGNDVLILSDFGVTGTWAEQLVNIKSTIKSFQDKYSTDLTFQARVDDALARILRLKARLYPSFDPASVIINSASVASAVGRSRAVTLQVAQDALTLLSPSLATVADKPLPAPTPQDSILIFTDDRYYKECSACPARSLLITDTLQQTMVRLYPSRIDPARVTSLTFSNLFAFLNPSVSSTATGPDVGAALAAANWVVFAVLDPDSAAPQSTALQQLVTQRPGLLANKKVIVFAFDAPHYLEPDVFARATAVYALYGRTDPFVEVAVRALFGDATPAGYPPVDVEAIGYRLIVQTEPNPDQIIPLFTGDEPKEPGATPVPAQVKVGDTLKVRTGMIVDRNGHPVPDGTQVTFSRTFSQSVELPPLVASTHNGVATVSFPLDRIGPLRVRASSDPAVASFTLQLTVAEQPSPLQIITPTAFPPTRTPQPTATASSTPVPTLTPTATPLPAETSELKKSHWVGLSDLLLALVGVVVIGGAGFWTQRVRRRSGEADMEVTSRAVRWGLWSMFAGLVGYVLYGLRAPGSLWIRAALGSWSALIVAMVFGIVPMLVGFRILDSRLLKRVRNLNRR